MPHNSAVEGLGLEAILSFPGASDCLCWGMILFFKKKALNLFIALDRSDYVAQTGLELQRAGITGVCYHTLACSCFTRRPEICFGQNWEELGPRSISVCPVLSSGPSSVLWALWDNSLVPHFSWTVHGK